MKMVHKTTGMRKGKIIMFTLARLKSVLAVLTAMLLTSGCATTFLVSKDCYTYYFGSTQEELHRILCGTGDLQKILDDSKLPQDARDSLYRFQCVDRSHDDVVRTYAALSGSQKSMLREAFIKNGYEINARPASNFHVYPLDINPNFCPSQEVYEKHLTDRANAQEKGASPAPEQRAPDH